MINGHKIVAGKPDRKETWVKELRLNAGYYYIVS
jgi:hypothetical protein